MPLIADGKFVVVGGASQVGAAVARRLLDHGAREVLLVDNLHFGSMDGLERILQDVRCQFIRADVLRLHELVDPVSDADGVFMVAAFMATSLALDPWTGLDVNIRGLHNVLEACRLRRVAKIVISSSAGVYGTLADEPTDERAPLRWADLPTGAVLYGASKIVGETLARAYHERYGLAYVALRYTAVYGERQHARALVGGHLAETLARIRRGERPIIDGDGGRGMDYVNVEDVARANLLAMESAITGEAINICSGVVTSQRRVVDIALQALGSDLLPESRGASLAQDRAPGARPPISRAKARTMLEWEPRISLEDGVRRMLGGHDPA